MLLAPAVTMHVPALPNDCVRVPAAVSPCVAQRDTVAVVLPMSMPMSIPMPTPTPTPMASAHAHAMTLQQPESMSEAISSSTSSTAAVSDTVILQLHDTPTQTTLTNTELAQSTNSDTHSTVQSPRERIW